MCHFSAKHIVFLYVCVCVSGGQCECLHIILTSYYKAGGKKKVSYLNPLIGTTHHVNSGFSFLQTKWKSWSVLVYRSLHSVYHIPVFVRYYFRSQNSAAGMFMPHSVQPRYIFIILTPLSTWHTISFYSFWNNCCLFSMCFVWLGCVSCKTSVGKGTTYM